MSHTPEVAGLVPSTEAAPPPLPLIVVRSPLRPAILVRLAVVAADSEVVLLLAVVVRNCATPAVLKFVVLGVPVNWPPRTANSRVSPTASAANSLARFGSDPRTVVLPDSPAIIEL